MLRNVLALLLIVGFLYTVMETKNSFTEMRYNRIAQIETALNR